MSGELGWGITLQMNGFTGCILDVSGPSVSRDAIDDTCSQSPNKWRTFFEGLKDAGEATFTVLFKLQNYNLISGSKGPVAINFPEGATTRTWTCDGFVINVGGTASIDDKQVQDIQIKFSGEPTIN